MTGPVAAPSESTSPGAAAMILLMMSWAMSRGTLKQMMVWGVLIAPGVDRSDRDRLLVYSRGQ